MIRILLSFLFLSTFSALATAAESVHDFKVKTIDGKEVSLSDYKGKVLLIVNVASKCGYTRHYKNLTALAEKYRKQDVLVLGFPANNFGGQEPGTNKEIAEFCKETYAVDFPMFAKVSVKGDDQADLFQYLTRAENQDFTGDIKWNFEKFVVDKNGKLLRRFRSAELPDGEKIVATINEALKS